MDSTLTRQRWQNSTSISGISHINSLHVLNIPPLQVFFHFVTELVRVYQADRVSLFDHVVRVVLRRLEVGNSLMGITD